MGGMKDKERFSAGLVSKPFWFYEYKTYAEQLNKGYTAEEIKAQALQMNLFPAAKEYRDKEILSCLSRRVMQFKAVFCVHVSDIPGQADYRCRLFRS